jgi:hypothetical protein
MDVNMIVLDVLPRRDVVLPIINIIMCLIIMNKLNKTFFKYSVTEL